MIAKLHNWQNGYITLTQDPISIFEHPDFVGEVLRNTFFNQKKGLGCCSTFELNDGVKEDTPLVREHEGGYTERWKRANYKEIKMSYFWDGDGTLFFQLPDRSLLVNRDCGKTYGWEFIKCPEKP